MSNEANKELVRLYFDEVWNKGNYAKDDDFVAPHVIVHAPPPPGEAVWLLHAAYTFRSALPDLKLTSPILFGDGDRVIQNWFVTGTHLGEPLYGVPASGRQLLISGVNMFRLANGKIVERWGIIDIAGLMQQLHAQNG